MGIFCSQPHRSSVREGSVCVIVVKQLTGSTVVQTDASEPIKPLDNKSATASKKYPRSSENVTTQVGLNRRGAARIKKKLNFSGGAES